MAGKRFAIKVSVMEADGRTPLKSKILKVFPFSRYSNSGWNNGNFSRKIDGVYAKKWLVDYVLSSKAIVKIPDFGSLIKYDIVEGNYA